MLLAVLACTSGQAAAQAPGKRIILLDRIVAVVNEDVITRRDLDDRMRVVSVQLREQGTPAPPTDVLEKQVLDRMIYTRVQLQFAKETGLRVDDGQLDSAIARIAENNKITPAKLRETLEKDGVSFAKFREDIRDEIVMSRLREREVDNKITVAESEIDNLLNALKSQDGKSEEFDLSHILVRVPEQASPEQLRDRRARAEQALAQIKGGTDFRQVAASFSDAPDSVQGGAMGWRELARLPSIFAETVKSMSPGEVSPILRSPNGMHIVRLNGRRGQNAPVIVVQTHPRHILIKTSEVVSEGDARERLVKLKERLDNKADFAELARLQSEDGSASRGGDLGWLSPGDTVPEFEKAMDALKVGEISGPVRSPFGWHIIQVIERRNEDMSKQRERLQARASLREQKADEAYQEWLRQLRDKAFVELRLEEK
ncbi:MAG TPA: peptidylprolyl isomerase [Burkholderiales bacterium]|jgi:peptidyl-prolyl cis-trans isomerase SurA|nr:peptidylprolyl isomerase [Burkholderiales bacterium]